MNAVLIEAIGLAAGSLTTVAFLPQVVKVLRTRSTRDISLLMYTALCAGIVMWILYGLLISSLAVILANCVTLLLAGAVLVMKLRCG